MSYALFVKRPTKRWIIHTGTYAEHQFVVERGSNEYTYAFSGVIKPTKANFTGVLKQKDFSGSATYTVYVRYSSGWQQVYTETKGMSGGETWNINKDITLSTREVATEWKVYASGRFTNPAADYVTVKFTEWYQKGE